MAESKDNILTQGLSGSIGGQLVFKRYGNRTIVSKVPDMSRVVKSTKQKKENSKFSEAIVYAKTQMLDPVSKAEYKAKVKGMQRPHNVAIADFYNAPEIRNVDISKLVTSKSLLIHAWDDFKVVKVSVDILTSEGVLIETGEAKELQEWFWEYGIISELGGGEKLLIQVWDKPGNKTIREVLV